MEHVAQVQKSWQIRLSVNSQMTGWKFQTAVQYGTGSSWWNRCSIFVCSSHRYCQYMMMSIYERTKEIGVMKVLGCDMGNIRSMFLIESGFIGFMGGVLGALLSYGVSVIVNRFCKYV